MFQKLSNSWELAKASARVLSADKELLLFPLFSGVALVIVTVSFVLPIFALGVVADQFGMMGLGGYIALFLFYFVQYFVIIFFNSALVGAALIRLDGGDPTVSDGLRIAGGRLGSILLYSLVAATVGVILRIVKERSGALGKILASLGGLAWNLTTFFVIPVLVTRGVGPIEAIKESARTFKRAWGEQIAGNVGIGFFFGILTFLYTVIAIPCVVLAIVGGLHIAVIGLVIGLVVVGYVVLALVSSALSSIYSAALYRFATTGQAGMFDRGLLSNAFSNR